MTAEPEAYMLRRYELKYLLEDWQYKELKSAIQKHMQMDIYGKHTVCNIYYDTEHYDLIRRSIQKPKYKEKLRLRSYGSSSSDDMVYLEIKKKYQGIVYKRRSVLTLSTAAAYLDGTGTLPANGQIEKEIDYFVKFYQPRPSVYIAYDREAYLNTDGVPIRLTLDKNMRGRWKDLRFEAGSFGDSILPPGLCLLEIKTLDAVPVWLSELLSRLSVYPSSFSKYGRIYQNMLADINSAKEI